MTTTTTTAEAIEAHLGTAGLRIVGMAPEAAWRIAVGSLDSERNKGARDGRERRNAAGRTQSEISRAVRHRIERAAHLYSHDGLKTPEIAERLGITYDQAARAVKRAKDEGLIEP